MGKVQVQISGSGSIFNSLKSLPTKEGKKSPVDGAIKEVEVEIPGILKSVKKAESKERQELVELSEAIKEQMANRLDRISAIPDNKEKIEKAAAKFVGLGMLVGALDAALLFVRNDKVSQLTGHDPSKVKSNKKESSPVQLEVSVTTSKEFDEILEKVKEFIKAKGKEKLEASADATEKGMKSLVEATKLMAGSKWVPTAVYQGAIKDVEIAGYFLGAQRMGVEVLEKSS